MTQRISRWRDRAGATLVEYTFIISIVSIAAVLMLRAIGGRTNDMLDQTNSVWPK